ncbi:MAG: sigma-54-dependent Fis family transcriptional regulator [Deltaproteobacteria bacterium]|nr:sigma-54-dependent Fis family transcriptional regulator [Deltaproteobacteria bacterium]
MASSLASARQLVGTVEFDAAVVDLQLGDGSGLDLVAEIRVAHPRAEVIVLTGHGTIDTAIEAIRAGAYDYLRKPCPLEELDVTLQKALERQRLMERNTILKEGYIASDRGPSFVGASEAYQQLCQMIDRVAASDAAALVLGETGVGKDVVARLIHARSGRAAQPMVVVECAALQEDLLQNELFGHEKGAYTGAAQLKHGLFEVANGGTIFLDEIGDVSLATQVKLLRVLETGTFRRVGGTREINVDVRLIAATNRDLQQLMEKEYFRRDLFYRMSTIRIEIPPLRQRPDDVEVLLTHFLERLNKHHGRSRRFSKRAITALRRYPWPGNVRELLHMVEQIVILSDSEVIELSDLPAALRDGPVSADSGLVTLADLEAQHIARVLTAVAGNRQTAATVLGISERTLYRKIKEYDL